MRSAESVIISVGSIINLWHTGRNFISRSNETVVQLHKCKAQLSQRGSSAKETSVYMRLWYHDT